MNSDLIEKLFRFSPHVILYYCFLLNIYIFLIIILILFFLFIILYYFLYLSLTSVIKIFFWFKSESLWHWQSIVIVIVISNSKRQEESDNLVNNMCFPCFSVFFFLECKTEALKKLRFHLPSKKETTLKFCFRTRVTTGFLPPDV